VGTLVFQVGAYYNQTREVNISAVYANRLGTGVIAGEDVSTIDVTTATGAQNALRILDQAITDVSNIRASLGATQKNVLESSINSLTIAKENIAASESTIRDTDMAAEMAEFTKLQILQQAGVAMLAQANQAPQALLALLR
jgi:flagellin